MWRTNWDVLLGSFLIIGCMSLVESISRAQVLIRANFWAVQPVAYSMYSTKPDPNGKQYRTDCSGYISMAWNLPSDLNTVTLPNVAYKINKAQLQAGDIIMKGGPGTEGDNGHVVIFEKWTDATKSSYWAYEQTPPHTMHRTVPYPYFNGGAYFLPYRYNGITGGGGRTVPASGCQCCKDKGLRNYCGHELCGLDCNAHDIYACSAKGTLAVRYGPCTSGCIGSTTNSACRV